jgi:hypothetical protein
MRHSISILLLLGSATVQADDWCSQEAVRSATLDAAGVTRVVITAGAGDLEVRGAAGETQLVANGRACASSDELLQQIQLDSRREGNTLYLRTQLPEDNGLMSWKRYARMDLTVRLPNVVAIELEDGSGDAELANVRAAVVNDGSGDLEIENIAGDVRVSDSSGDVEIERVAGNLHINDSSGDLELEHIKGAIDIEVDSSGDIRIEDAGRVHVQNDSSGEIFVRQVQSDVKVDVDSSGDIDVADIGGNFTVRSDGSGDIRHDKIVGTVQIPQS